MVATQSANTTDPVRTTIDTYDRSAAEFVARAHRRGQWGKETFRLVRFCSYVNAPAQVLDLGCGPGNDMQLLEKRGYNLTGADLSAGMLAEAKQHVEGGLLQADMRLLPLADNSFDGVWMSASLLHLPREDALYALAEVRRLLRPRGIFYLTVIDGQGEAVDTQFNGERHFTYYGQLEILKMAIQAGFGMLERWENEYEDVTWVNMLLRRI